MLQGKAPIIYGDGEQTRCFSYIDDCLSCLIPMLEEKKLNKQIINEIICDNQHTDEILSFEEIAITNNINEYDIFNCQKITNDNVKNSKCIHNTLKLYCKECKVTSHPENNKKPKLSIKSKRTKCYDPSRVTHQLFLL